MDQEKINMIIFQMTDILDNMQLLQLKKVLEEVDSDQRNVLSDDNKNDAGFFE